MITKFSFFQVQKNQYFIQQKPCSQLNTTILWNKHKINHCMDYGIVSEPFVWLDEFPDLFVRDGKIVRNHSENSVSESF